MPQNEVAYKTDLDQELTLKTVLSRQSVGIVIVQHKTASPRGIAHLEWTGRGKLSCAFGSAGGLDIHFDFDEDLHKFVGLVKSVAVYKPNGGDEWVLSKQRYGRIALAEDLVATKLALVEERSLRMPPLDSWRSVFGPVDKSTLPLSGADLLSGLDDQAKTIPIRDISVRDTKKEAPNLLARTPSTPLFELRHETKTDSNQKV